MRSNYIIQFTVILIVGLIFGFNSANAQGVINWIKKAGGINYDRGYGIAVDDGGNTYVTGYYSGTATFGQTTLTANGPGDSEVFIAKYNSNGDVLWAKKGGGTGVDIGSRIKVDNAGNCYVVGSFQGTATFGDTTLICAGYYDGLIIKYNTSGDFQWAASGGGTGDDHFGGLAISANGDCLITGSFKGTATFGNITLTSVGSYDEVLLKYNPNGLLQWAKRSEVGGAGIDLDQSGNIYISGYFNGNATFGTTTHSSSGGSDICVLKYDPTGEPLWIVKGGGTGSDETRSIVLDSIGNCYVTGSFAGSATFGNTILTSTGYFDFFLVKYDSDGQFLWAKQGGGTSSKGGNSVAIGGDGYIYLTGSFDGTATFGNTTLTSSGFTDGMVVKYNSNGDPQAAAKFGGSYTAFGYDIAMGSNGESYITGFFRENLNSGSTNLTSFGLEDVLIIKISRFLTGVEEEAELQKISVYPNPFTSNFNISLPSREQALVVLTDVVGKEVYRNKFVPHSNSSEILIPEGILNDGVYFIIIKQAENIYRTRILRQ